MLSVLSEEKLRHICPLKWHSGIPEGGSAMGIADIDFAGPPGIQDFIKANIDVFDNYQAREGLENAIKVGREFLGKRHFPQSEDIEIQVIPGTMIGIYATMKWAAGILGDVVITNPIYPPIHFHASGENDGIQWVKHYDTGRLDIEGLKSSVNKRTKLIAINTPNNPLGTIYHENELKAIRDLAVDYDVTVFSDELYAPLDFNDRYLSIGSLSGMEDRTITLFGFSKAYGLAGYRSGFMVLQHSMASQIKEIIEHLLVSPSPFASLTMQFALSDPRVKTWVNNFKNMMQKNTERASQMFRDAGYHCITPEGGFFVFPSLGVTNDSDFKEKLLEYGGVEVVEGSLFGPSGNGSIRVNCATSLERVETGVRRIIEFTKKY